MALIGSLCSSAAFTRSKLHPRSARKRNSFYPIMFSGSRAPPEGAKPEEKCEHYLVSGDEKTGASGQASTAAQRARIRQALGDEPDAPLQLGISGEFIYGSRPAQIASAPRQRQVHLPLAGSVDDRVAGATRSSPSGIPGHRRAERRPGLSFCLLLRTGISSITPFAQFLAEDVP